VKINNKENVGLKDKDKDELKADNERLHKKIGRRLALRGSAPIEESTRPTAWNERKGWR